MFLHQINALKTGWVDRTIVLVLANVHWCMFPFLDGFYLCGFLTFHLTVSSDTICCRISFAAWPVSDFSGGWDTLVYLR